MGFKTFIEFVNSTLQSNNFHPFGIEYHNGSAAITGKHVRLWGPNTWDMELLQVLQPFLYNGNNLFRKDVFDFLAVKTPDNRELDAETPIAITEEDLEGIVERVTTLAQQCQSKHESLMEMASAFGRNGSVYCFAKKERGNRSHLELACSEDYRTRCELSQHLDKVGIDFFAGGYVGNEDGHPRSRISILHPDKLKAEQIQATREFIIGLNVKTDEPSQAPRQALSFQENAEQATANGQQQRVANTTPPSPRAVQRP